MPARRAARHRAESSAGGAGRGRQHPRPRGGEGGVGLRLSHAGQGVDYAFTLQQARHSLPYFELNPAVRAALLADPTDPAAAIVAGGGAATFTGRHPRTTVVGGDIGLVSGAVTWRLEAAWLSDVPVTTRDLRMETVAAVDWAAGVEFYPGDADTRAKLQLTARHLLDAPAVLDRTDIYALGGELETVFASYAGADVCVSRLGSMSAMSMSIGAGVHRARTARILFRRAFPRRRGEYRGRILS